MQKPEFCDFLLLDRVSKLVPFVSWTGSGFRWVGRTPLLKFLFSISPLPPGYVPRGSFPFFPSTLSPPPPSLSACAPVPPPPNLPLDDGESWDWIFEFQDGGRSRLPGTPTFRTGNAEIDVPEWRRNTDRRRSIRWRTRLRNKEKHERTYFAVEFHSSSGCGRR